MNNFKFVKNDFIIFISLLCVSIIYILPITLNGRYYIDDLGRSIEGYTSWGADGRPLASYIMRVLSLGIPLLDITPFYQIMGVTILSWVFVLYYKKYLKNESIYLICLSYFIFLSNPFLIENLSYRYDSFFMLMSIVFMVFPFTIKTDNFTIRNFFIFTVCVISSFCCYQSSIGLWAIFIIIDLVYNILNGEEKIIISIRKNIDKFISFVLGFYIYKKIIVNKFVIDGYAKSHSELISFSKDGFYNLVNNITIFLKFIEKYFLSFPKVIIAFYLVVAFIVVIFIFKRIFDDKNKFLSTLLFIFLLLSPFFVLLFSILHICLIKHPVLAPRVFTSFCGVVFFGGLLICFLWKNKKVIFIIMLPIAYINFLYGASYSNVSSAQNKTDQLIISSIAYDISHYSQGASKLSIIGKMPVAKELTLISKRFPLMSDLIPIYMNNNWSWGKTILRHYNIDLEFNDITPADLTEVCNITPVVISKWYSLYSIEDEIIISFDNKCKY